LPPILFNLYSDVFTKEAFEVLDKFKLGGQKIRTVKYAIDLVLLSEEEAVLQGMFESLAEIGRCYRIKMQVEKSKLIRISMHLSPLRIIIDKKTAEECGIFQSLG
jgi:hypothetical protein